MGLETGLELKFVEEANGLHLKVNDGWIQETEELACESYIFYVNNEIIELWFNRGPIQIHCPKCGKDYELIQQQYEDAFYLYNKQQRSQPINAE